jgi:molybdate transport system substrate-binding protein
VPAGLQKLRRPFVYRERALAPLGIRITSAFLFCLFIAALLPVKVMAGEATIAVATNFSGTLQDLQKDFEASGNHKLAVVSGSTGKLAAQILEGAPFDVFLSADDKATKNLAEAGRAVAGSEFTYAIGTLALYSADPQLIKGDGAAVLKAGNFSRLAIANPKLAPYGLAAETVMKALGVSDALRGKIVMGENIAQTFQMIDTGNAEVGFVALSQVLGLQSGRKGSHWTVPATLHEPIRQNAVLLAQAKDNEAARAFLAFLRSPRAKARIGTAGYATPDG